MLSQSSKTAPSNKNAQIKELCLIIRQGRKHTQNVLLLTNRTFFTPLAKLLIFLIKRNSLVDSAGMKVCIKLVKYIPLHRFRGKIFLQVFDGQGVGLGAVVSILIVRVVEQRPGPGTHVVRRQHATQFRWQNLRQNQLV